MTEPSQYFKGRTVQEQMNEVIGYVDVRSAEVATDAIAADVAQVHQDMLDADADAQAAAASAAAAAGTLANAVKKTGEASQSIAGNIEVSGTLKSTGTLYATGDASVGGNLGVGGTVSLVDMVVSGIAAVPTPTANGYAANKKYVDDADALKVNITDINSYAVGLTGNQGPIAGNKRFVNPIYHTTNIPLDSDGVYREGYTEYIEGTNNDIVGAVKYSNGYKTARRSDYVFNRINGTDYKATLRLEIDPNGVVKLVLLKDINGTETSSVIATM